LNTQQNAFQRHFVSQVKKADEILRRLKEFQTQIELYNNGMLDSTFSCSLLDAEAHGRSCIPMDDRGLEIRITMHELEV
jgi:hypothetical protein